VFNSLVKNKKEVFFMKKNFSKLSLIGLSLAVTATNALADVTYTKEDGFGGSIDTTAFDTAIPIVVTVVALVVATTLGMKALKSAKSA
jgi:hypothetical protein